MRRLTDQEVKTVFAGTSALITKCTLDERRRIAADVVQDITLRILTTDAIELASPEGQQARIAQLEIKVASLRALINRLTSAERFVAAEVAKAMED